MDSRIRTWLVATASAFSAVGCQEPREIVPVAPYGMELQRVPKVPQGTAEALGEQAVASAKPSNTPSTAPAPTSTKAPVPAPTVGSVSPPTPIGQPMTKPSGLIYETLKEGTGPEAQPGQNLSIHYTGTLASDGSQFDSSRGKSPFPVQIGTGQVIPGWDEGVPGMKVGERRKLTIPPDLAYGSRGQRGIPANSTLIFDVELMEIK